MAAFGPGIGSRIGHTRPWTVPALYSVAQVLDR